MQSPSGVPHTDGATRRVVRLYYLDWLCVLSILAMFIYHLTRFFNMEVWLVKNPTWHPCVEVWSWPTTAWLGYSFVQWSIPDLFKRRFNLMRFLFGMKPLRKQPAARSREAFLPR